MKSGVDFINILKNDDDDDEEDNQEEMHSNDESTNKTLIRRISSHASNASSTASLNKEREKKQSECEEERGLLKELEASSEGKVEGSLMMHYVKYAKRPFSSIILIVTILLTQILVSSADVWVSYW